MGDRGLRIYFTLLEALAARLPPDRLRRVVHLTGALWRPHSYRPLIETILGNLKARFPDPRHRRRILFEMLRLEARQVAENYFLREESPKKVRESFCGPGGLELPKPALILSAHLFNFWLLTEYLRVLGQEVILVIGARPDPERAPSAAAWSGARAFKGWQERQRFIVVSEGRAFRRSEEALLAGDRVLLLLDVPRPDGLTARFLGNPVRVSARGLFLAERHRLPTIFLAPTVSSCLEPYGLWQKELPRGLDARGLLQAFFEELEAVVHRFPASWMGWLHLHRLWT